MDITATCAEITVTFPGGSASFNKEITTTEIVVAQNPESEDRVYLNQNSANAPLTFWWNLNKAIEFGYNTLQELYDYFVAEIANQCGGGGGGVSSVNGITGVVVLSTSDIADSTNKRYVTDANLTVIGNTSGTNTGDNATNTQYSGLATSKQDALVSGTNIKTINGTSILGSGNIVISAASSLSGLTAATATNTIDNLNFQQNWNFSTLDTTIGLKIATAAAQTTSATQVLVQFRKTNTTTGVKASAVLEVINEDANLSSTSVGARFEGRNYATVFGGSLFSSPYGGNIGLIGSGALRFGLSSSNYNSYGGQILESGGDLTLLPNSTRRVSIRTGSLNTIDFMDYSGNAYCSMELNSTNNNRIVLGGNRYSYRSTYGAVIDQTSGVLKLGSFLVSGGEKFQLSLSDASNNVGIGTTTPNASAKLEVASTTQGVLLPRMTTTQKNAIATPLEGLEVYDLTLHQKSYYNGTIWINY